MKKALATLIPVYILVFTVIGGTGLIMILRMRDRVDYKYCSDNGVCTYYTVTGTDTTHYRTAWELSNFSLKWVAKR